MHQIVSQGLGDFNDGVIEVIPGVDSFFQFLELFRIALLGDFQSRPSFPSDEQIRSKMIRLMKG
jgi:hypothetical protein